MYAALPLTALWKSFWVDINKGQRCYVSMYIFQKSNWNKEMLNPLVSQDFCFISRSRISYFQVNEIQCFAYLLFLSWPGKCKQKTYLNSRNICNFCPLCSSTGWSSLEASVIRERETETEPEAADITQLTSQAHYQTRSRSCSLGLSLLSLHEPLSHYSLALPLTYPPS